MPSFNRGLALLEELRYAEADSEFQTALQSDGRSIPLLLAMAITRYYQGTDLAVAERAVEEVARAVPDRAAPYYVLGHIRAKAGRLDDALAAFESAGVHLDRPDPYLDYSLGVTAKDAGRLDLAVEALRRAVSSEPAFTSAWYALGQTLLARGRAAEGSGALARFEQTREQRWAEKFQFRYRGMGRLMVIPDSLPPSAAPAATISGYRQMPGVTANVAGRPGVAPSSERVRLGALVCPLAAGGAVFDANGDGKLDIYEARCDPDSEDYVGRLLIATGDGRYEDRTIEAGLDIPGLGMGAAVGDIDNDGDPDLVVSTAQGLLLFENRGGHFIESTKLRGLNAMGWCGGVVLVDFDHDGDLDLYVARVGEIPLAGIRPDVVFPAGLTPLPGLLYENDGHGQFTDVSARSGIGKVPIRSLGALWLDVDGDNDVDLLQFDVAGSTRVWLNERDGTFRETPSPQWLNVPDHVVAATAADVDGDGHLDLVFSRWDPPALVFRFADSANPTRYASRTDVEAFSATLPAGPAFGVSGADLVGDGRPGLLAVLDDRPWFIEPFTTGVPPSRMHSVNFDAAMRRPRGVLAVDVDADGADELLLTAAARSTLLTRKDPKQTNSLRLQLHGKEMSNLDGFGSVVDARSGTSWQTRLVGGGGGYLTSAAPIVTFAFGSAKTVDLLRITWPSGIRQPMAGLDIPQALDIREQGLKSSCPLLFTWDGEQYRFISDLLGATALGIRIGEGDPVLPDDDELIRIPDDRIHPIEGRLKMRLVEQLEEILYTDRVELLVVDHPNGTEVVPRERYQFLPPRDATGFRVVESAQSPLAAVDGHGNNVFEAIRRLDGWPMETFDLSRFSGFAAPHALVLDLGYADPVVPVALVLDGWVRYATVAEMEAAAAAGVSTIGPRLEIDDGDGNWRLVSEDVGVPAGLPKTMYLDLTGAFRTRHQRIRLTTNLIVWWDRIRVARSFVDEAASVVGLRPQQASLWKSGYPLPLTAGMGEPVEYDGNHFRAQTGFSVAAGGYTRFGDVTSLVAERDDLLVVQSHGEALDLEFNVADLPACQAGFRRSYLFRMEGWIKDQEAGTVTGQTVAPLPFHAMETYPYAPTGVAPDHDVEGTRWNTRVVR